MPLLDHFHPPLKGERHWESFHGIWAAAIVDTLNVHTLPPDYFPEFQVHIGGRIEVDVATFERAAGDGSAPPSASANGGTATLVAKEVWAPPAPDFAMPAVYPDEIEIQVFHAEGGPTLVAAIEFVSPGNKDREEHRRAFVAKCASYLHAGVGLILVDVVTTRRTNLHDELVRALGHGDRYVFPRESPLYATAYRPVRRVADEIEVWRSALAVGQLLPVLPLALRGDGCVPVDFEAAYTTARQRSRLA
jgi:hypothetical protein